MARLYHEHVIEQLRGKAEFEALGRSIAYNEARKLLQL